ncbi:sigma-54-dependent transcriptional regulator [Myxococcota bacterium]
MPRILVVEDDADAGALLVEGLSPHGFEAQWVPSAQKALDLLETDDFEAVVTDLRIPGMNGVELCERIAANRPNMSVVVVTAFGSLDAAIAAIRAGADDFVTKPFEMEQIAHTLKRTLKNKELREEVQRLRGLVAAMQPPGEMIGSSAAMKKLFSTLGRIAGSDASVLLTGESGTGKELVARAIHQQSLRKDGPFVAINCAAMPDGLLESELFGHVRGAFTDAKASRAGLFVDADGGTLFLDEIGELPLHLQPKLLRALQERSVRPVGGSSEVSFDVRVVFSTNRDLEAAVSEGSFREDLYYRLNVIHLGLPPLRIRGNDVLLLAQHFLKEAAAQNKKQVTGLTSAAAERLLAYNWPGNVRELENCIERAVALTNHDRLTVDDFPDRIRAYRPSVLILDPSNPDELVSMEEVERRYVSRVLESVGGNKTLAAKILGFDRKTLYNKLHRYGWSRDEDE